MSISIEIIFQHELFCSRIQLLCLKLKMLRCFAILMKHSFTSKSAKYNLTKIFKIVNGFHRNEYEGSRNFMAAFFPF